MNGLLCRSLTCEPCVEFRELNDDYLIRKKKEDIQAKEIFNLKQQLKTKDEKIQELEKENEELKKSLGEAVKMLNESCKYNDSWITEEMIRKDEKEYRENGFIDPDIYIHSKFVGFLNKPEIQKYIPEGKV